VSDIIHVCTVVIVCITYTGCQAAAATITHATFTLNHRLPSHFTVHKFICVYLCLAGVLKLQCIATATFLHLLLAFRPKINLLLIIILIIVLVILAVNKAFRTSYR